MIIDLHGDEGKLFRSFKYPAGEWQVRLTEKGNTDITRPIGQNHTIIARLRNSDDFMRLALLSNAMIGMGQLGEYYLPYLPYSRADRRFQVGDCAGLTTFLELMRGMTYNSIITLDMHNRNAIAHPIAHYPVILNISPETYIIRAITDFSARTGVTSINVLFPDLGASKRYDIPTCIVGCVRNVSVEFLYATKKRDATTGKLSGFEVPRLDKPTLIVDDICDGGGTFLGIADIAGAGQPLGLYVTHGIFSKGLDILLRHFEHIYYTDSYWPLTDDSPKITQYSVLDVLNLQSGATA